MQKGPAPILSTCEWYLVTVCVAGWVLERPVQLTCSGQDGFVGRHVYAGHKKAFGSAESVMHLLTTMQLLLSKFDEGCDCIESIKLVKLVLIADTWTIEGHLMKGSIDQAPRNQWTSGSPCFANQADRQQNAKANHRKPRTA